MAKPVLSRHERRVGLGDAVAERGGDQRPRPPRLTPLAITSTARFMPTARKTTDFAIWATVQPMAAASLRRRCVSSR